MRRNQQLAPAMVLAGLILVVGGSPDGVARAREVQTFGAAAGLVCGHTLSEPVLSAWQQLGGESGRLGCPTENESASSTSPQGSESRIAVFGVNGEIVLHASGPRAGQAFVVSGCIYRLYTQYGGPSGWLGLPTEDPENTPDGSRQTFEGGLMRYGRALDECEAAPAVAQAAPPAVGPADAAAPLAALDLFEDPATGDRLSLAAKSSIDEALAAGYRRLRTQAEVFAEPGAGTTPLKEFLDDAIGLREVVATPQSERDALAAGFAFDAGQGFVWTDPRSGAVPLKLYRDQATGRTRLTAGDADEAEAAAKGYRFIRVEGYAAPPPAITP